MHAVYDRIGEVIEERVGSGRVQAILFDLGVSSVQLDESDRGFAYAQDAPLDMRMDPTAGITAADVVNTYPGAELTRILREYGEERFASRISRVLVVERARQPFTTSARLVELVRAAIPAATRRTGGNPAKRTFQALRIEVNDELGALRRAIPVALQHLSIGRPDRGDVLPVAGGPDRQARHRTADGVHQPAGPAGRPTRARPGIRLADQGGAEIPERVRDPGKPQGRVRATPGGAAHQGGNIVTTDRAGDRGSPEPGPTGGGPGHGDVLAGPALDDRVIPPRVRAPAAAPAEDLRDAVWSGRASR